ncbi:MAG: radical SAM protein [Bacteroidetes bacterium]|nr:radical SAM protein [Bacteroidota bacterium]
MLKFTEKEFKTILNVRKYIDSWFWDRYGIGPYNGCLHNCTYCDCRATKYYLHNDFGEHIIIKKNIGKMLDQRISRARTLLPDVVGIGGPSDGYMTIERKYRNTRRCLEVLHKHKWPVFIATKGLFVLDDLELLDETGKETWCTVALTITAPDKETARFLEPGAPTPDNRFEVIKKIKEKSMYIKSGVLFIPIPLGFSDSDEQLEDMVRKTKEAGGDFILFGGGITLTDKQALYFLEHLNDRFPEKMPLYEKIYRFSYDPAFYNGTYGSYDDYCVSVHDKLFALCVKYDLPYRIKRYIPDDYRKHNYILAEKLLAKAYRLQMIGKPWTYLNWAGLNIQNLQESVVAIAERNELRKIRNVSVNIETFIKKYIEELTPEERRNGSNSCRMPTLFG